MALTRTISEQGSEERNNRRPARAQPACLVYYWDCCLFRSLGFPLFAVFFSFLFCVWGRLCVSGARGSRGSAGSRYFRVPFVLASDTTRERGVGGHLFAPSSFLCYFVFSELLLVPVPPLACSSLFLSNRTVSSSSVHFGGRSLISFLLLAGHCPFSWLVRMFFSLAFLCFVSFSLSISLSSNIPKSFLFASNFWWKNKKTKFFCLYFSGSFFGRRLLVRPCPSAMYRTLPSALVFNFPSSFCFLFGISKI